MCRQIMDTLDLFRVLGQHPLSWPILNFLGRSTKQGRYKAMSVSNLGTTHTSNHTHI
jgi:hypothetical protein